MLTHVSTNLKGLLRFTGRASRADFWPYALGVTVAAMLVVAIPFGLEFSRMIGDLARFAAAHPEHTTVISQPGNYALTIESDSPELTASMGLMMRTVSAMGALSAAVIVALLAAAVTRRLHDVGKSGLWGLMPLPFGLFSIVMFPKMFASIMTNAPHIGLFITLFISNALYLAALLGLLFLLCKAGDTGANRFGPAPAHVLG